MDNNSRDLRETHWQLIELILKDILGDRGIEPVQERCRGIISSISFPYSGNSKRLLIHHFTRRQHLDYGCGNRPYEPFLAAKYEKYVAADIWATQANIVIGTNGQIPTGGGNFRLRLLCASPGARR